jgi:hypothetical protein
MWFSPTQQGEVVVLYYLINNNNILVVLVVVVLVVEFDWTTLFILLTQRYGTPIFVILINYILYNTVVLNCKCMYLIVSKFSVIVCMESGLYCIYGVQNSKSSRHTEWNVRVWRRQTYNDILLSFALTCNSIPLIIFDICPLILYTCLITDDAYGHLILYSTFVCMWGCW